MGERYYTHYDGPFTGLDVDDDDDHSLGFSRVSVVKSPELSWESSSCPTSALALLSLFLTLSRPAALPRCHLSLIFLPHFLPWHSDILCLYSFPLILLLLLHSVPCPFLVSSCFDIIVFASMRRSYFSLDP